MKSIFTFYSLSLVKEKSVKYEASRKIKGPEDIYDLSLDLLHLNERPEEYCYLFALNTKNEVIGIFEVSHGTIDASLVTPSEVFKRALMLNATSIIIVHNHPSGDVTPSDNDKRVCGRLQEAGDLLGIKLLDFIIVGDSYYSFSSECIL